MISRIAFLEFKFVILKPLVLCKTLCKFGRYGCLVQFLKKIGKLFLGERYIKILVSVLEFLKSHSHGHWLVESKTRRGGASACEFIFYVL